MDRKYKGWSIQDRDREYARLKHEWEQSHAYNEKACNKFICRITLELGL